MKTLVYSSPFNGHLNILRKMMDENKQSEYKLVIAGWDNFPVDNATVLAKSTLKETDPSLWTLPRVHELMDDSLSIAKEYRPDLIIYDFFSWEGQLTGKTLRIPYWCSIPAMIGPNDKSEYLAGKLRTQGNVDALAKLRREYELDISDIEMVSDGLHLPGQVNLVWSYPELTPPDFMKGRKEGNYRFVGNYNRKLERNKDSIYFSFGTVVMDNLWNQQEETRAAMRNYVAGIAEGLEDEHVVFVTQGKHILDNYPKKWSVKDRVDQVKMLARSRAFITHGGSNSYHEAVLQKVPMVVVPFFGDQILVGQTTEKLGLGINLGTDDSIDTKKPKGFLDRELASRTVRAVKNVLADSQYQQRLDALVLTNDNVADIMKEYFSGSNADVPTVVSTPSSL